MSKMMKKAIIRIIESSDSSEKKADKVMLAFYDFLPGVDDEELESNIIYLDNGFRVGRNSFHRQLVTLLDDNADVIEQSIQRRS